MTDIYTDKKTRILRNAARCNRCGTEIESKHVHDFVRCNCPGEEGIFVDGGHDYIRRGIGHSDYENLSEAYKFEFAVMRHEGEKWIEMRLLEEEILRVRRRITASHQEVLDNRTHKRYDSLLYAYSVWRVKAQDALIREHKKRKS